ncbi:MAG: hypothetical protein ABIH42_08355, partial [Planctomycetota bacterium]
MKVALIYNLIRPKMLKAGMPDSIAELDSEETIAALEEAVAACGHRPILLEVTEDIYVNIRKRRNEINIVFNIAEGTHGESRESHIPCFLEMLGIPYTGSSPLTLSNCLNKIRAKDILLSHNIPTPKFQVFKTPKDKLKKSLRFPLIVKLANEGSSMGLSDKSVVKNETQLKKQVKHLITKYNKLVFAEEFKSGREFTIPVLGNNPPIALPIIEAIHLNGNIPIVKFSPDSPVVKMLKLKDENVEIPKSTHLTVCPADIDDDLSNVLSDLAVRSYKALGCYDWCRLEIRLDEKGNP